MKQEDVLKPTKFALLGMGIIWWLGGCGYTLQHRLKGTFVNPKGIFVPVFDNLTDEIGAERVFTNALIRELANGREVLLSDRAAGGLELRGVLTQVDVAPTTSTELGFKGLQSYRRLPTEVGVRVTMRLNLFEISNGQHLWSKEFTFFRRVNAPLSRTFDYEAPSSLGPLTQSIVESTYADLARDIMRDVYDEMMELF